MCSFTFIFILRGVQSVNVFIYSFFRVVQSVNVFMYIYFYLHVHPVFRFYSPAVFYVFIFYVYITHVLGMDVLYFIRTC